MPESSGKLLDLLAIPSERRRFADIGNRIAVGAKLPAPAPVFPRYVERETEAAQ
jgi:methionyl-tRNA synthetase